VLKLLGQGGMGVVLAAYDSRLDRRVALKLLRPRLHSQPLYSHTLQARLLREAQAMARLSHPHVVSVYDTGHLEDGSLFISMEFVEGQTLKHWSQQPGRSWRAVLSVYLEAGRGLAAAHAAGLIHRDFKPDNVLVDQRGQVRVTDFGLARAESSLPPVDETQEPASPGLWESHLTLPGAVMGTPAYMSPESLLGQPADARSDLFSFCVALYEALYGRHPFQREDPTESLRAQTEGRVHPPPASADVPAWVARAVLQGLESAPHKRPASMEALIAALEDSPEVRRRARRRLGALAAMGAMVATLAIWGLHLQQEARCTDPERKLAGVWDKTVREKVERALRSNGLTYAPATAAEVSRELEDYARQWTALQARNCEAGQHGVKHPRSLAVLQEYCLERRRSQLRALTELLSRGPDKELLPKAVQAVQTLPPLEYCADERALTAAIPPPEDPTVRAQSEALLPQVDRLEALLQTGKYKEGLALGEQLLPQVEAVGYAPLRARVLFQLAWLKEGAGDYTGAEQRVREAMLHAARGRDHELVARSLGTLLKLIAVRHYRYQEALALEPVVEMALEWVDDARTRVEMLSYLSSVPASGGRFEQALRQGERALALSLETLGPEHLFVAEMHHYQSGALIHLGRYEESRQQMERSLELRLKALGPEHPLVARSRGNLARSLQELGRHEEARQQNQLALAVYHQVFGPEHPDVAKILNNLGVNALYQGHEKEALQHLESAVALKLKALGPEHPVLATVLANLGNVLLRMGRYTEARQHIERAVAIRHKALGPDHFDLAPSLDYLGGVLTRLGKYAEARQHLEHALALRRKEPGPPGWEHPDNAWTLLGLARLQRAQHRPAEAVPLLERALRLELIPARAEVRFELAQALWETGKDRSRAVALATEARAQWLRLGDARRSAEASRWLTAHPTGQPHGE
jgi:serine/threonine-protein kinase